MVESVLLAVEKGLWWDWRLLSVLVHWYIRLPGKLIAYRGLKAAAV